MVHNFSPLRLCQLTLLLVMGMRMGAVPVPTVTAAFVFQHSSNRHGPFRHTLRPPTTNQGLDAQVDDDVSVSSSSSAAFTSSKRRNPSSPPTKKKTVTAADLRDEILANPAKFERAAAAAVTSNKKKSTSRRTRKRVENPQQRYVYASQRQQQQQQTDPESATEEEDASRDSSKDTTRTTKPAATSTTTTTTAQPRNNKIVASPDLSLAKELGWSAAAAVQHQCCDDMLQQPRIVGKIRVHDDTTSTSSSSKSNVDDDDNISPAETSSTWAYLIEKPAGWSIMGSVSSNKPLSVTTHSTTASVSSSSSELGGNPSPRTTETATDINSSNATTAASATTMAIDDETSLFPLDNGKADSSYIKKAQGKDDDGSVVVVEYNELDVWALMTPEEIAEYLEDLDDELELARVTKLLSQLSHSNTNRDSDPTATTSDSSIPFSSQSMREVDPNTPPNPGIKAPEGLVETEDAQNPITNPTTAANRLRIAARSTTSHANEGNNGLPDGSVNNPIAKFNAPSRPSVIAWLKETKAASGTPIRGGNFWTALAGAVDVDDSGLVLVCPKTNVDQCHVEFVEYIAVVGTGGSLDPSPNKAIQDKKRVMTLEPPTMEIVSKLRKGRGVDIVQTVQIVVPERASTCAQIVDLCQEQFLEGIRGDPAANPLDRRAPRRLLHCQAMSVSSMIHDDSVVAETAGLPDDIAVLSERRNHLEYKDGSFLGRFQLKNSAMTNAYREINGAADGFPGWTVDRYGDWLSVTHDPKQPRGPLPSIHDNKTKGVYYLESNPDRSTMGAEGEIRPRLLEGQPAPDLFPVLENGVTYLVSLDRDLSTGIFLDQRPQRAWLRRNCGPDTRVLNCFAHTGAFSVAAAAAGASTVSLDLSKKWLDRLPQQLEANGIPFDENHDCIYGDCFEWLARLAKRDEKYDIVILDPPSTSVGQKRRRWSIKDMDELVALAARVLKKGGLLWTTTNSAALSPSKFASLCRQGFVEAGITNVKLERVQPMPADFPSIGSNPVKNLIWRVP